jgi:hypothetical protein
MTVFQRAAPAMVSCAALALAACGGGGASTGGTPVEAVKLAGHFVDAPVAGLCYTSSPSGLSGVSNATGDYQYVAGDTVTFSIPTAPGNCSAGTMALVAIAPSAPATGDTQTFVLDVPNGQRVAEVLNALNHGSSTAMDVSGLTMPSAAAADLSAYIKTGATPSGLAATDLLSAAQSSTVTTTSYVLPVTASFTTSVDTHLSQSASSLATTTTSGISLSDLAGTLWFRTSSSGGGGMDLFNSLSQLTDVDAEGGGIHTQTLVINGNAFTLNAGTANETKVTVNYRDAQKMLYSSVSPGSTVTTTTGTLTALQPIGLADVAGKTLTFKNLDSCNGTPMDFVVAVSADGSTWQSQTFLDSVPLSAGVDPAVPGLIKLTTFNGTMIYLGLPKGSALTAGGKVAFVNAVAGTSDTSAHFNMVELLANPATAPVCSSSGGGSANSGGTLFYSTDGPMMLTATQVYVRYVGGAPSSTPGKLAVLPKDYQLCVFADATGQTRACGQVSDGVNAGNNGNGNFANQMVLNVAGVGLPGTKMYAGWVNTTTGAVLASTSFNLDADGNPPSARQFDVYSASLEFRVGSLASS